MPQVQLHRLLELYESMYIFKLILIIFTFVFLRLYLRFLTHTALKIKQLTPSHNVGTWRCQLLSLPPPEHC